MNVITSKLMTSAVCLLLLLQTTNALYGLCSTDWFTEGCFDNGDECQNVSSDVILLHIHSFHIKLRIEQQL